MSTENYDVEDLSAEPLDPDHLYEYVMEHYGQERLAKLAAGVCMARQSSSGLGELSAVNNTDKIRDEYDGLEYDSLAAEAREYSPELTPERAVEHIEEYGGSSSLATRSREQWEQKRAEETNTEETDESTTDTSEEFVDRLDAYCESRDVDYEQLLIMTEDDYEQLKRIEEREVAPEDVEDVLRERERLTDAVDLPEEECRSLGLSSLRRIAGNGDDGDGRNLTPSPRSGDHQAGEATTRYDDPTKAEELKKRIEYIENNSSGGELMMQQKKLYEEQLAGLEK